MSQYLYCCAPEYHNHCGIECSAEDYCSADRLNSFLTDQMGAIADAVAAVAPDGTHIDEDGSTAQCHWIPQVSDDPQLSRACPSA